MSNTSFWASSQDGSPFDLPKKYPHNIILDYNLNKSFQLYNFKNYDLAYEELKELYECGKNYNSPDLPKIESILDVIEHKKEKRNSLRKYLTLTYTDLVESKNKVSFDLVIKALEEFKKSSIELEEYSKVINEIIDAYSPNKFTAEGIDSLLDLLDILTSFSPLRYIIELAKIKSKTDKCFILFDLDSTLFDNSPRVHKIIQDFINTRKNLNSEDLAKLKKIKRQDIVWGMKQILSNFEVTDDSFISEMLKFWYERFFSNSYIIDTPLKGADIFVKEVEKTGVKIVYLTGRFESMREGTSRNLKEYGFPLDKDGSNLILKPDPRMSDHDFKDIAMKEMKKFGNMIAGFDNEPINANIFKTSFPEANVFFVETNHSPNPPNILENIHTIKDFYF